MFSRLLQFQPVEKEYLCRDETISCRMFFPGPGDEPFFVFSDQKEMRLPEIQQSRGPTDHPRKLIVFEGRFLPGITKIRLLLRLSGTHGNLSVE